MMQARDILKVKGSALFTAEASLPFRDALAIMARNDVGSLAVLEDGKLRGMLTFREILMALHETPESFTSNASIASLLRAHPAQCSMDDELDTLRDRMIETHARYLPVVEQERVVGVISFYDVARAFQALDQFENNMLKTYIRHWPDEEDRLIQALRPCEPVPSDSFAL